MRREYVCSLLQWGCAIYNKDPLFHVHVLRTSTLNRTSNLKLKVSWCMHLHLPAVHFVPCQSKNMWLNYLLPRSIVSLLVRKIVFHRRQCFFYCDTLGMQRNTSLS